MLFRSPPPAADLESIGKMADTAIAAGPDHEFWYYFQFVKGLAEYRLRHFASAVERLQKVAAREGDPTRTEAAYMVLAMAQYQLKQVDEARATLVNGINFADANRAARYGPQWNDERTAQLLMREARALIERPAKASDQPK